jgi:hypothetical protein
MVKMHKTEHMNAAFWYRIKNSRTLL